MSAETPDHLRIIQLETALRAVRADRDRIGDEFDSALTRLATAGDRLSRLRRQHAAALALCDEAESAVGSGCLCRWDEDGSPVGEHGPRCFKTFGWDLDPAAVRAALEETP